MSSAARIGSTALSAILLVAVNAIPLVGVAFWGWSLMLILVLYWLESGVVGVLNVFKIALAQGGVGEQPVSVNGNQIIIRLTGMLNAAGRGALIGFFVMHYGMFWAVHGVFVFLLPLFAGLGTAGSAAMDFGPLPVDGLLLSFMLLAASHVVSFFTNYLGRSEYLRVTAAGQMKSVYGRVAVLHITIIAGAFAVGFFGTPFAALALLVALKTSIDLVLHLRQHRRIAA